MSNRSKTLFIIRAQDFDIVARTLAERLAAQGVDVIAVVDERKGTSDTAPFPKLSLHEGVLEHLG